LRDRRADAVEGGFAVRIHIVESWRIEIGNIGGVSDKDDSGRKFRRAVAVVFGDLLHLPIGRDRHHSAGAEKKR